MISGRLVAALQTLPSTVGRGVFAASFWYSFDLGPFQLLGSASDVASNTSAGTSVAVFVQLLSPRFVNALAATILVNASNADAELDVRVSGVPMWLPVAVAGTWDASTQQLELALQRCDLRREHAFHHTLTATDERTCSFFSYGTSKPAVSLAPCLCMSPPFSPPAPTGTSSSTSERQPPKVLGAHRGQR